VPLRGRLCQCAVSPGVGFNQVRVAAQTSEPEIDMALFGPLSYVTGSWKCAISKRHQDRQGGARHRPDTTSRSDESHASTHSLPCSAAQAIVLSVLSLNPVDVESATHGPDRDLNAFQQLVTRSGSFLRRHVVFTRATCHIKATVPPPSPTNTPPPCLKFCPITPKGRQEYSPCSVCRRLLSPTPRQSYRRLALGVLGCDVPNVMCCL